MSFENILRKYRESSTKAEQGTRFEMLMKAFLLTAPVFKGELIQDVWLWNEFPSKKDFGSGHDTGIDLVVRTKQGEYWAVQCKCYSSEAYIDKPAVDSFMTTSARGFTDVDNTGKIEHFSRRIWFDTSGKGFNKNAEDSIKNQNPPVTRMGYYELADSNVDWDKLDEGLFGSQAETVKYSPREHQQKAIELTHEYFKLHDRGKLIMACGTGKTFTSLKIAEKETESIDSPMILFLAPSISLVGQTLKEWTAQSIKPIHGICICSDPKVSQKETKNDDSISMSIVDLALPASTNRDTILDQIQKAKAKQKEDGGMVVVFSTYQSIQVVHDVQEKKTIDNGLFGTATQEGFVFDLCICDEAHRTTGVTAKGGEDSAFVLVHDSAFIRSNKRLYMTATPKLYAAETKKKAENKEATVWSMDDEAVYGEEIYRIGFGEAVKLGLLSDYKVIVLTLNEDEVSSSLQNSLAFASSKSEIEIPTDDSIKLIGCINALSKITKDEQFLNDVDPGFMHNAIAFCQNIKISKKTVDMMKICHEAYFETLKPDEREKIVEVEADHIDGSMNSSERSKKLDWLKKVDRTSAKCNVLMNVRCLSEGVDVPSLDAVLFLSSRNSQVDVVQSVGRVMRKAPNKNYGYIIIPVVIPSGVTPEDALDQNDRFAVVWDVLQALRAHDERFNATINKIELNKRASEQILVGGSVSPSSEQGDGSDTNSYIKDSARDAFLNFDEIQGAVYAKMVQKVGSKRYWEQWAQDVASIAERHIASIASMVNVEGSKAQTVFQKYLMGLRKNINPNVTETDAIEMLAQHFITKPVFEALFEGYSFVQNNAISKSMQGMVKILEEQTPKEDNEKLERFYSSVQERAKGIDSAEGRQKVIVELYNKFFKTAFPKTVEKLGIVYTPVEIVDFIINSVNDVLKKNFGRSLSDENVHILDPFTGTGTFIVRLLQSGLIKPEDMGRKYKNELHACEIVLLAYYIASVNIESAYHFEKKNDYYSITNKSTEYEPFDGIVLTDTFQMTEDNSTLIEEFFPQNSSRVNNLKKTPINVIIGNPPYSRKQSSANDDSQNQHYLGLEESIRTTYGYNVDAGSIAALYDSYIKAFKWSEERITDDGIIAYITNSGYLKSSSMSGLRREWEKTFEQIIILDLRGGKKGLVGESARKEGENVFNITTGVCITILVKKKENTNKKAKILYYCFDDYLNRNQKFSLLKEWKSCINSQIRYKSINPTNPGMWLHEKNSHYDSFFPISSNENQNKDNGFFTNKSLGVNTNRDKWVYGFSKQSVLKNCQNMINNFNTEIDKHMINPSHIAIKGGNYIPWSSSLDPIFNRNEKLELHPDSIGSTVYRPFVKEYLYFGKRCIHRPSNWDCIFPQQSITNSVICIPGVKNRRIFSTFITDGRTDLNLFDGGAQCFPLYWYEKRNTIANEFGQQSLFEEETAEYIKKDGISDFILEKARKKYGSKVTKSDIFYYVYGLLNSKDYAETFANVFAVSWVKIPLVSEYKKFYAFSNAGRTLANLHLNYEQVSPYPDIIIEGDKGDYTVTKMRYPNNNTKDTIIFNTDITIKNIPEKAYEYVINGKSAIAWIMEFYQDTTDPNSGIRNNPNDWGIEHGNPRYILDLLLSVINVSVQTVDIINSLPEVEWDKE